MATCSFRMTHEATTLFIDLFSITIPDLDHSVDEQRYIDLGSSDN